MIDINLTLIVQIIHFGVAYFLIRTLFLKPLIEVIEQEDHYDRTIRQNVSTAEKEKAQQEHINADLWASAQRSFAKMRPEVEHEPQSADVTFVAPSMTSAEIKQKQELLARDILQSWERQ